MSKKENGKMRPLCPAGRSRIKPKDKLAVRQWRNDMREYRLWRRENVEGYEKGE